MMNLHQWKRAPIGMGRWRGWLINHGSLTQRLKSLCPGFHVRRLRQARGLPFRDEAVPLGLDRNRKALIREVLLMCGDRPLVFAHTVIPLDGLSGPWRPLAGLGNQSLGAMLFSNPKVARFPLEYSRLTVHDPLYRNAARHLQAPPPCLWARRSLFALDGHRIQVSEVFLPTVLDLAQPT
jgi:chorismate--pyruvate lyase